MKKIRLSILSGIFLAILTFLYVLIKPFEGDKQKVKFEDIIIKSQVEMDTLRHVVVFDTQNISSIQDTIHFSIKHYTQIDSSVLLYYNTANIKSKSKIQEYLSENILPIAFIVFALGTIISTVLQLTRFFWERKAIKAGKRILQERIHKIEHDFKNAKNNKDNRLIIKLLLENLDEILSSRELITLSSETIKTLINLKTNIRLLYSKLNKGKDIW